MTNQEILWKYAEGKCDLAEVKFVEQLLADEPSLQSDLDKILEVQSVLVKLEADSPSMRFSKNILEALPDIYPSEATEPLVSSFWKKLFIGGIASVACLPFLVPDSEPSSPGGLVSPYVEQFNNGIATTLSQVPNVTMLYFILTLFSLAFLLLMDKVVLKKMKAFFFF